MGFMGGHVDDFNRGGDLKNGKWLEIRTIDEKFKWGTIRLNSYRHIGMDVNVIDKGDEFFVSWSRPTMRRRWRTWPLTQSGCDLREI